MYRKCFSPSGEGNHLQSGPSHGQVEIGDEIKTYRRHYTTMDYTPWAHKKSSKLSKYLGDSSLPPCTFGLPVIDWINRKDVRKNLHIPDFV